LFSQEPFELVRTAKKSKSSLTLMVGGQDVTRQDQRLTEAELESRFSASLLPRTLVFTQEDLLELLQVCGREWVCGCGGRTLWCPHAGGMQGHQLLQCQTLFGGKV
jgi:hypothetical protein